jgi:hypothetical protein
MYDSEERIITYTGTPTNSKIGLGIEEVGLGNKIYSNTIIYATEKPINIEHNDLEEKNILKDNRIINPLGRS